MIIIGENMRKDTVDRMKWASKLHGKARRRASKASKRADKDTFKHELGEFIAYENKNMPCL